MSRLARGLLLLALPIVLLPPVLVALALQHEPRVTRADEIAPEDVERALQVAQVHDPRRALPGIVRTLVLSQHEAELLLNHTAARWLPSRSTLELQSGRLQLLSSVALPANPFGRWLNVELVLHESGPLVTLDTVRVGRLTLPAAAVRALAAALARRYGVDHGDAAAALVLHGVRFSPGQLRVVYAWGEDAPARVLTALMPAREQLRVKTYATHLAEYTARLEPGRPVSLSQLLPPMFELARKRSAEGGDAALENRAALLVLGMVANGVSLATLLPERAHELRARPLRLTLAGRRDSTQHFLVSATIAAGSGSPLADLVGLYKELADARGGSGFSFNDMAANRAGTRFGALAVQSPDKLQQRLAGGVIEQDFMPDVADLPEFLHTQEFRRRFGGPGSPEYERLLADIEGRLDATALFR